jgi:hypothetical protein
LHGEGHRRKRYGFDQGVFFTISEARWRSIIGGRIQKDLGDVPADFQTGSQPRVRVFVSRETCEQCRAAYCSNGRGCALAVKPAAGGLDLILPATLVQPSRAKAKNTASSAEPRVVNDIPRPSVRQMALKAPMLPDLDGCVWFMLVTSASRRAREGPFRKMLIRRQLAQE